MMTLRKFFISAFLLSVIVKVSAQDSLSYKVEAFAAFSSEETNPYWIVNNSYGKVPLQANSGYVEGALDWKHTYNKDWALAAGLDLLAATHHTSSFYIQQLYGQADYKSFRLLAGIKENYNSILDRNLSSGDLVYSANARPIPEVNISIPKYIAVPFTKGYLNLKGDFAVGRATDDDYTLEHKGKSFYTTDVLYHHKSLFFLLKDKSGRIPVSFEIGMVDAAQWGGYCSNPKVGDIPQSFGDFIRVVLGESGDETANESDQINALGNHLGTYNFKLKYEIDNHYSIAAYKQHYFEDKSGMELANWRDGIWGIQFSSNKTQWMSNVVFEFIDTRNQSGPFHFIDYDPARDVRGGGSDNYYNNGAYPGGWSHWGRALGNPLLTSPEYNAEGILSFQNNRIRSFHFGLDGKVNALSYRALATYTEAWGTHGNPFLSMKRSLATLLECNYSNPAWKGWSVGTQFAVDKGTLYGDNLGCSFKVSKSGIIKF